MLTKDLKIPLKSISRVSGEFCLFFAGKGWDGRRLIVTLNYSTNTYFIAMQTRKHDIFWKLYPIFYRSNPFSV